MIRLKRVYEKIDVRDGERILVDKMWPRGIRRSTSNIDIWVKKVAPSDELRRWFSHDPKKWMGFKKKYKKELASNPALDKLINIILSADPVTLLYSARDTKHNNAVVLLEVIKSKLRKIAPDRL
ncbi:DUF488 family protein [Candidatus Marsarchaeota archaeon]|nr:DUF488 family protein [Candidatus Marsarchaeota archaeon]